LNFENKQKIVGKILNKNKEFKALENNTRKALNKILKNEFTKVVKQACIGLSQKMT